MKKTVIFFILKWSRIVPESTFVVENVESLGLAFEWPSYLPASKASREVTNLTERKNLHTPVYCGRYIFVLL